MSEPAHLLVVDDDPRVRDMLCRYLAQEGFRATPASDGAAMRRAMEAGSVDLVLLDLVMPGEDGLVLARELRSRSDVPIIMLTGKGDMIDRVVGLEMGADDYIAKPFHLREVLARIKTVLRRAKPAAHAPAASDGAAAAGGPQVATFDGWRLDMLRRELRAPDGQPVSLTTGEFNILTAFIGSANRVLSRDQLMDLTRSQDWTPFDRSIDNQIVRLRKKLERDPANPQLIKTVRGAGYIFTAKVDSI